MRCVLKPGGDGTAEMMKEAYAYFPIEWAEFDSDGIGNSSVVDPLTIYVRIPFDGDAVEYPTWAFSLQELLEDFVDGSSLQDGSLCPYSQVSMIRLRRGLKKMVAKIDGLLELRSADT